ncbi:hypothetical protein [Bacillus sp. OAE603]|uniref:hypothetical protein n=1 Tax=Gottfriedia sp. OAE603 TaxID=2663872 RepID=UPI0017896875
MKKTYLIVIAVSVLAIFLFGFQYGKRIYEKPTREITVGINKSNKNRNVIEFKQVKLDNQSTIDKLELIFLFSNDIDKPSNDLGNYDVQLSFKNGKKSVSSYSFNIWFTKEGDSIIQMNGINRQQYRSLDKNNTNSLKEIIKYKN